MKGTNCGEDQAMIEYFVEQTRDISKCVRCTNLLHDPVKSKCGHLLCRTCMFKKSFKNASSLQVQSCCAICQDATSNNAAEEVSLKTRKLSSCLQQFVKDFCSAGNISVGSSGGRPKISETQEVVFFEENVQAEDDEESYPAMESETCSGSILMSGPSSLSLTSHSALPLTQKVGQWLLTNPNEDLSTIQKEEDIGNGTGVKNYKTLSFQSLKVSPKSMTASSHGKELSYDIVSAPSPPPPHEDIHTQVKQGRPRRGRGRPRKNALPISSGESSKKRERSKSITPETKLDRVNTPTLHLKSFHNVDEIVASKATMKTFIATTLPSMSPLAKNNGVDQCGGPILNEKNIPEEGTRQIFVVPDVQLTNIVLEESTVGFVGQCVDGEYSLNHHADVECAPDKVHDKRSIDTLPGNAVNLHQLPINTSSRQPEKSDWTPPTAHHLTPVSRPKTQNWVDLNKNYHQTPAQELRSHAPSPAFSGERRTVSFFHKGRMTPRTSINSFKSQLVAFTRLGRLGPILGMSTSGRPFSNGSCIDTEKIVDVKETHTCSTPVISLASIATQTDAVEATWILAKEAQSRTDSSSQRQISPLPNNAVHIEGTSVSPYKESQNQGSNRIFSARDSDECSEDMFAETFKRVRVLSSSDNEMAEPKRRKPSILVVNPVPVSSVQQLVESNTALAKELRQHIPELNVEEGAACKTVVMESDADSDEGDILMPTPPRPSPPNPAPRKRKVFTCSGIARPEIKMIEDWANRIGAEVSPTYNSSVTHVIVCLDEENCAQRTLKFLYGVASGNWIVGVDWVHQCIRQDRLIDEEPFEALDMDGEDGPRRARQTSQREKLFEAFEFCCQGPFTDVTVDQLNQLLKLCGAATVPNPSQLTKTRRYTMIVVQTEEDVGSEVEGKAVKWFDSLKIVSISREWVLDCLAAYQLLPVRNQLIGKYSVSMLKMMGFDACLVI